MNACFCSGKCRVPPYQCPSNPAMYVETNLRGPDRIQWVPDPEQIRRLQDIQLAVLRRPREMTREDLGLPLTEAEAPYAFWLGADA